MKDMNLDNAPSIDGAVIPVYVVSGIDSCSYMMNDIMEYIFEQMWDTGESVGLANIVTFGG